MFVCVCILQAAFEVLGFVSVLSNCWLLLLAPRVKALTQDAGLSPTSVLVYAIIVEVRVLYRETHTHIHTTTSIMPNSMSFVFAKGVELSKIVQTPKGLGRSTEFCIISDLYFSFSHDHSTTSAIFHCSLTTIGFNQRTINKV